MDTIFNNVFFGGIKNKLNVSKWSSIKRCHIGNVIFSVRNLRFKTYDVSIPRPIILKFYGLKVTNK